MGCDKYADVSKYIVRTISDTGIELNTSKRLDLSVLAGTFFFAVPGKDDLQVTHLTFRDSRYKMLHCRF